MENDIRLLRSEEIAVKAQSFRDDGAIYVLYKDSRVDMNILDEAFGCLNWKKKHFVMDSKMFCTISIYNSETKEWVDKTDCGCVESGAADSVKAKGEVSDSFKRAATCVGIGRELYTAPFIWVPKSKLNMTKNKNGKPVSYDELKVCDIEYTNRQISYLQIINTKTGEICFTAGKKMCTNIDNAAEIKDVAPSGTISVTEDTTEDEFIPSRNGNSDVATFVIPVGYAKGQTIDTFFNKNKENVQRKKGDDFAKIDVFEWYCTNLKGKPEYKDFIQAILTYCAA